jgi:hypothetical protein
MRDRICDDLRLEHREVLQKERRQETIFTKGEQVLLVQHVYVPFGVLVDDTVGNDDGSTFVRGAGAVERGASGKTRYRSEQTLECL